MQYTLSELGPPGQCNDSMINWKFSFINLGFCDKKRYSLTGISRIIQCGEASRGYLGSPHQASPTVIIVLQYGKAFQDSS